MFQFKRIKDAQQTTYIESETNAPAPSTELPPTPFLFKNKIKYGKTLDSPNPLDILKLDSDSFEWLDDNPKSSKEQSKLKPKLLDLSSENFNESNENINIVNTQETIVPKPVSKFRLSDSFLQPVSKSPPKMKMDLNRIEVDEKTNDVPLLFCDTEDIDIHKPVPETPLSKYYLSKKKKSRISELISTLSVADVSNGEIDLKLDQKGGATRDNNYSTILNETPDFLVSDNENN